MITCNAKIIVAGEHAVLDNSPALVLPVKNHILGLNVSENSKFAVSYTGDNNINNANQILHYFILNAANICQKTLYNKWSFNNNIPVGAGLGFSAALAAIVAKHFASIGYIKSHEVFSFAHELEQPIHGHSSGCDIAGALATTPIVYKMTNQITQLNQWSPYLAWTSTKTKSNTKDQVKKVKGQDKKSVLRMQEAAELAIKAWRQENISMLSTAMTMAESCFLSWNLVTQEMADKTRQLKDMGALACKPSGAGGGGCILSLWPSKFQHEELNWIQ